MRVVFAISAADENSVLLCVFFFCVILSAYQQNVMKIRTMRKRTHRKKKFETDVDENEA